MNTILMDSSPIWLAFTVGLFLGTVTGIFIMALIIIGREDRKEYDNETKTSKRRLSGVRGGKISRAFNTCDPCA